FPGYGWLFPGPDGRANAGLGLGTGSDRRAGASAARQLDAFLDHLRALGLLDATSDAPRNGRLGGWLKMGMVGTVPARGSVLLVAAGPGGGRRVAQVAHAVARALTVAGSSRRWLSTALDAAVDQPRPVALDSSTS